MSVGVLSPQQLRSIVDEKWKRDPTALVVGFHVDPSLKGPEEVAFEVGPAKVVRANTVLRVRQALLEAEQNNQRTVLLTNLQQSDLGNDVVARLVRSRLFSIDHWASLSSLFKAKDLDRTICNPAIVQALIDHAPPDGYPPVKAGVLDAGTVWRAIFRNVYKMEGSEPDLVSLLLWASSDSGNLSYHHSSQELRDALQQRLISVLGEAANSILQFMESGASKDALALAVACQVVFGDQDQEVLDAAAARMEQYHGNRAIARTVGRSLGNSATLAIADLDRDEENQAVVRKHLQRADELLHQFLCQDHAYRNQLTLLAYEQRLTKLAGAIERYLESKSPEGVKECEECLANIASHRRSRKSPRRHQILKAEMAVRLVRWISNNSRHETSLADHAARYVREVSFVDRSREPLCRGDESPDLSAAYKQLDAAVTGVRRTQNREFAAALADWTSVGSKSSGTIGVEDVLGTVVSKLATAKNRVLFVVMDGMSWAVCHELLDDIRQDHWFEATLDDKGNPPVPIIATVPSVTQYSRCSLLSGKLVRGDSGQEKSNFEANKHLAEVCDKRWPPRLFHKKDLTDGNRGSLSDELSKCVLSQNHHVVGVVINAIDDRLSSAQQITDTWSVERISPLGGLLRLARDSGRVVVLASDHGHVWHRPDAQYRPHDTGSRWRPDDGKPIEDEVVLAGSRVKGDQGDNRIIAPWFDAVYYGRQQNGYHGGASPQEMVCPLVILTDKSSSYTGLYSCDHPKPDWWSVAPTAAASVEELRVTLKITPAEASKPQLDFFEKTDVQPAASQPKETAASAALGSARDWIDKLLNSQAYKDQKTLVRRHAPEDTLVRAILESLLASGGVMTPIAFARSTNIPPARLDGLIARLQRVLNVDGYEVLVLDRQANRIEVNVAKLKRQFDLE